MVSVLNQTFHSFNDALRATKDPEVDTWLLMGSPVPIISIISAYLIFVLHTGPKLMENRKSFNFPRLLVGYNVYQILFSAYLFSMPFQGNNLELLLNNLCHPRTDPTAYSRNISSGAWYYFMSKVVDLADTVFFVLRKKQNQVSFLHVYHHTITCLFAWAYLKYLPGEQGVIIGTLNSAVHIVMYSYYLIAAMGPEYTKYLWWKKYMTWIQLVQFCLMLTYLSLLLTYDCSFPKGLTFFFVGNVGIFLFLFARFYINAYKSKQA